MLFCVQTGDTCFIDVIWFNLKTGCGGSIVRCIIAFVTSLPNNKLFTVITCQNEFLKK